MSELPDQPSTPRRRWPQFSLRTLLLLVTVFGVWLGTIVHRAHRQREAAHALRARGAEVVYDWQIDERNQRVRDADPPGLPWLRDLVGDEFFQTVHTVNAQPLEVVERRLMGEVTPNVRDRDLVHLQAFPGLKRLFLTGSEVTDAGLLHLSNLKDLELLYVTGDRITDAGLVHLEQVTTLEELAVEDASITDTGLRRLETLKNLRILYVKRTSVTDAGVAKLKEAIPELSVRQ